MTNLKRFGPMVLVIVLLIGVVVGVSLLQRQTQLQSNASQSAGPALAFFPKTQASLIKDGEFYIDLVVNTDNNLISGADVEIRYPDSLRLIEFRTDPGSSLETTVVPGVPDNYSNTLRFVAVNKTGNLPVRNAVKLGDLKFKAIKNGTAKVIISNAKLVIATQGVSVTPVVDSGEYTVGSGIAETSSNPTSAPTSSPSFAPVCVDADADGNNCVDINDYNIWRDEYFKSSSTKRGDFYPTCSGTKRGDGVTDIFDAAVWAKEFTLGSNKCK